jgi:hypothetical protein
VADPIPFSKSKDDLILNFNIGKNEELFFALSSAKYTPAQKTVQKRIRLTANIFFTLLLADFLPGIIKKRRTMLAPKPSQLPRVKVKISARKEKTKPAAK